MAIAYGALIGGVIGLIIVGIMFLVARSAKPSFDAKRSREGSFGVAMAPKEVTARLKDAAGSMGYEVALLDEANDRIILSEGFGLTSYGNFIPVTAVQSGGETTVTVGLTPKAPQYGPMVTRRHKSAMESVQSALGAA